MNRLGVVALALAGAAYLMFWACTKDDPSFCVAPGPGCPVCDANRCMPAPGGIDGGGDAAPRCQTSAQCPLQGPKVCFMGTCVECQTFADCDEGQVCSVTHECAGCAEDVDCASDYPGRACIEGRCQSAMWVDCADGGCAAGDGSQARPLCEIDDAAALAPPIVVMKPQSCYQPATIEGTIQIWGRGSKILVPSDREGIHIAGGSADVTLHDLEIIGSDPRARNGVFIENNAIAVLDHLIVHGFPQVAYDGIQVLHAQRVVIRKSLIYGNHGWGIQILSATPSFSIENSFILQNGSASGGGGVSLSQSGSVLARFVFNTVDRSIGPATTGVGVQCDGTLISIDDSLVPLDVITTASPDTCTMGAGTVGQNTGGVPRNPNQIFVDWNDPAATAMGCGGFHINQDQSQNAEAMNNVIGKGTIIAGAPTEDFDGQPRPMSSPTPGADEPLPCR